MGNDADYLHSGKAKISYERLKPGCKKKTERHMAWVDPSDLTKDAQQQSVLPGAAAPVAGASPSPRKSPRVAERSGRGRDPDLPELAAHERARKLPQKKAAPVRGRQALQPKTNESKVSVDDRVKQFPGHSLANCGGELRCLACKKTIFDKHSSIASHCKMENAGKPTTHATNIEKWLLRSNDDTVLKQTLVEYFAAHPDQEVGTNDVDALVYRYRVAESFVACPPFEHIDRHRHLLQRAGVALTGSQHLRPFVPQIEEAELKRISMELVDQYIGVAFDGTTRLGEAINVTGRWCTSDFQLVMRMLDFETLKKHVDNQPHHGAKALWKETVAPAVVPGYSKVGWYSKAEIQFVIAEAGMNLLGNFIGELDTRDYGDATRQHLRRILELAAMLDMRVLVSTMYELEGDWMEILLTYDRIEHLRALGRSISANSDGMLQKRDAVLRRLMKLKKGVEIEKHFDGHGKAVGKLEKKETVDSTLYVGQQRDAWLVKYSDGHEEHFEEEELRSGKEGPAPTGRDGKPVLIVRHLPERKAICDALKPGFDYLESRIDGTCNAQYSLVEMYELCRVARAFDPNFAAAHVTPAFVDAMSAITPLRALGMLADLKQQLPAYLATATAAPILDKKSVDDYSEAVLKWWRSNGNAFPAWALAARIVFAMSPNSASCERVFALLKNLFGDEQMSALRVTTSVPL